jgi:hypothetical protein
LGKREEAVKYFKEAEKRGYKVVDSTGEDVN